MASLCLQGVASGPAPPRPRIAARRWHTAGLQADGTVRAVRANYPEWISEYDARRAALDNVMVEGLSRTFKYEDIYLRD
jgi:hypothetical protein